MKQSESTKLTIILTLTISVFLISFAAFLIWLLITHKKQNWVLSTWISPTTNWLRWIGNTSNLQKQMGPFLIATDNNESSVWTVNGNNVVLSPITKPISANQMWYFYSGGQQQSGTDQWPAYIGINKNQILTIDPNNNLIVENFDPNTSVLAFNQLESGSCIGLVYLTTMNSQVINYIGMNGKKIVALPATSSADCGDASNLMFGVLVS